MTKSSCSLWIVFDHLDHWRVAQFRMENPGSKLNIEMHSFRQSNVKEVKNVQTVSGPSCLHVAGSPPTHKPDLHYPVLAIVHVFLLDDKSEKTIPSRSSGVGLSDQSTCAHSFV